MHFSFMYFQCYNAHLHFLMFRLSALVHDISKTEVEVLNRCAHFFKVLAQPLAAAQVYEKLGDTAGLIALYVECKQWQMVTVE